MKKLKKNQEIVYDATFVNVEKDVKVRFVITKSKITETRRICGVKVEITGDIYNLYRVHTDENDRIHLLTTRIIDLCMNTIKYILELNGF